MKKHEDPVLLIDDVLKKIKNVKKTYDKLNSKKKPKEEKKVSAE